MFLSQSIALCGLSKTIGPVVQSFNSLTTLLRPKLVKYMPATLSNTLLFLAHLSQWLRRAGVRVCLRASVPALTLLNMNISATGRPIATKFYLKHQWGGGKTASCFWPDRIGTLVSMATNSWFPWQPIAPIGL